MNHSLQLSVNDDNTRVEIRDLIPGCTESMIYDLLSFEDISTGILHEAISSAVKQVNEKGEALHNVCIVSVESLSYSVQYGKNGVVLTSTQVSTMQEELTAIGTALKGLDYSTRLRNGMFVKANETIFTVMVSESFLNVFGNEISNINKPAPLPKERCIAMKTIPEGYQLVALVTGYVIINEHGAFDIVDPFLASADKLILYAHVVPLIHGKDSFIDKIIKSAPPSPASVCVSHIGSLDNVEEKDHLYRLELRRGRLPVPGRPGTIRFFVTLDDIPKHRNDNKIDYKEISCFKEIKAGTLLAERVPFKQSIPGVNVFGESIEITKVKDVIFSYGNGVHEEFTPELIRYTAKELGVLEMNANYLNIVPELIIHGDVGNATGNIKYSRSVTVKGTILSGYRVECGDLTVRESIEDVVDVVCTGNLFVSKGILGERTKVVVAGDAKTGLVQGATMRVQGDLTIEEFAYHSKIFCGKNLVVNGKGMTSREKGCIIGGSLSCLNSMQLHSVGSVATLTTLCCGFDPEGYSILINTLNLEKTLKKKIMQLQNSLHFNPSNKEVMLQRIQLFSQEKRDSIKQTLQELRQTIAQTEKAAASAALLSRKVFSADILQANIRIYHHIISPTLIEFPKLKRKVYRDSYGVQLCIVDGDIAMHENLTDQSS